MFTNLTHCYIYAQKNPAVSSSGIEREFFSSIVVFPSLQGFRIAVLIVLNLLSPQFDLFLSKLQLLATTSLVTTIQTFVAGTASHHDMTAYITGRCITLHALGCSIDGIHNAICLY